MRLTRFVVGSLALLASTAAWAGIFVGNPPQLTIYVDRPESDFVEGAADLDFVRLHGCAGGSQDFQVDQAIDPVAGHALSVASGEWCGATFFWASDVFVDGGSGQSAYSLRYGYDTTYIQLTGSSQWVKLAPFAVESGTFSGYAPRLYVTTP